MPIVKANLAPPQPQAFTLRDVEREAVAILARAKQAAADLMHQAEVDAEAMRQSAHGAGEKAGHTAGRAAGFEEGVAAGRKQALADHSAKLSELIKTLADASAQLDASRSTLEQNATRDVVELSVAVARKTVAAFARREPAAVVANVAEALRFVVGRNDVKILVHGSQQKLLEESLPALKSKWPALMHVQIVPDDSIAPGGARIVTQQGEVDATLDGMIDRIAVEILGEDSPAGGAK